jgi:hypothetical protein
MSTVAVSSSLVAELVSLARCFDCIPREMRSAVKLWLLYQWANVNIPTECTVILSGAGTAGVNQTYTQVSDTKYSGSSIFDLVLDSGTWSVVAKSGGLAGYYISEADFPGGIWSKGIATLPVPTGQWVPADCGKT